MSVFSRFLFPPKTYSTTTSWLLLLARIIFGIFLMTHGIAKWSNFEALSTTFADPLGVGHQTSLILAIFGEVFCSLGFIFGALYRLALIPMIFTMCIAFFVIHSGDPFSAKELPLVYIVIFVLMFVAGPGDYSVDRFVAGKFSSRESTK